MEAASLHAWQALLPVGWKKNKSQTATSFVCCAVRPCGHALSGASSQPVIALLHPFLLLMFLNSLQNVQFWNPQEKAAPPQWKQSPWIKCYSCELCYVTSVYLRGSCRNCQEHGHLRIRNNLRKLQGFSAIGVVSQLHVYYAIPHSWTTIRRQLQTVFENTWKFWLWWCGI